jgi:hypothetical protein
VSYKSSNDEGCHEPCLGSDHLVKMGESRYCEEDDEGGGGGYRWVRVIKYEFSFFFRHFEVYRQYRISLIGVDKNEETVRKKRRSDRFVRGHRGLMGVSLISLKITSTSLINKSRKYEKCEFQ